MSNNIAWCSHCQRIRTCFTWIDEEGGVQYEACIVCGMDMSKKYLLKEGKDDKKEERRVY